MARKWWNSNYAPNATIDMKNEHGIYIGKWPDCGCVTAACVDDPAHKKDTAKFIADLIKDGRVVERISPEHWHTVKLGRCQHRMSPKDRKASTDSLKPKTKS